uniref:Uncharacterized protein LOC114341348 n=1 Tax=Diabrotica virgifera virgifera TaxID=50390 RepID=A0A6P7GEG4_DIAVI
MPVNKEEVPRQIIAEVPSGSKTIEATNKITTPARSRQNRSVLIRKNGMDYLKNKHDKQYNLRERELALEEKKVELEDKRLQLEQRKIQLQENKWENEFNERKLKMELELQHIRTQVSQSNNSIALIESQAKVIETLLKRLERYEN